MDVVIKENVTLERRIAEAIRAGKYMIGITYKTGDKLQHHFITNEFPRNDIMNSCEEIRKLAEPESKGNVQSGRDQK